MTPIVVQKTSVPAQAEPTPLPSPSPTPFYYKMQAGDTISAIALRYGVDLAAVLAANPNVNPNAISIGTDILIPTRGQTDAAPHDAVVVPIQASTPICYPQATGGLWCFTMLANETETAAEGLVIKIIIGNNDASQLSEQSASTLLNIIRAGAELPAAVYFPPPVMQPQRASAIVANALPLTETDQRYLNATIRDKEVSIHTTGKSATVTGRIRLEDGQQVASRVWVLAAAFDENNHLIGLRRWESPQGLDTGQEMPFSLAVYSAAGRISHVMVYMEAQK